MTIEIKQLVIRAVVDSRRADPAMRESNPHEPAPSDHHALSRSERAAVVAACVREVLRELRKARER
jgi:hypothetical protein